MSLLAALLDRPRLVLGLPVLMAAAGVLAWAVMPRQEDPRLPARWGFLSTPYPGAVAESVERLVLEPIEEALAEVEEVVRVESTARAGVGVTEIELASHVYDTDQAWDRVRRALEQARAEFPAGVAAFELNDDVVTPESIVLALVFEPAYSESGELSQLLDAAREVKGDLSRIPSIKRIRIVGNPGEEVAIEIDDAAARRLALDTHDLALQLERRNESPPAGALRLVGQQVTLSLPVTFRSLREIRSELLLLESGSAVPLEAVASIALAPASPPAELMRYNGQAAVGLAISPRRGVDILRLGSEVLARLEQMSGRHPGIRVLPAMFQPMRVEVQVRSLGLALASGIVIVSGVLFASMGLRTGLAVAAIIPLVAFSSLALYAAGGGILHQISIAALVISLGLIVDNAIVMVEAVRRHIDQGRDPSHAALLAVRELAVPLAVATATTVAAFLPMYLSRGTTADFVRAIPIVVISCLVTSYVFALLVSPVLARLLLGSGKSRGAGLGVGFATGVARLAVGRPVATLGLAGLAAGLCALGGLAVPRQFFPAADRNQLIVTLELPEGTHILTSDAAARRLEDELKEHSRVRTVTTFVGRAPPLFYYNINRRPSSPHLAQLVVETDSIPALRSVSEHIRGFANSDLPAVVLGVRRLSQGMPIDAPIEIRVYASDRAALQRAGEAVLAEVRAIAGTADVHHDLGLGVPTLEFEVNDAAARRKGISRADIALALRSRSRGLAVGEYHGGSDPVPIVIRSAEGEDFPVSRLTAIAVSAPGGQEVPLAHLASIGVGWRPGAIHRRQGRNLVTVSAQLEEGVTAHAVMRKLRPALERLELPEGVALEFGGETEGSQTANAELFRHFPLAFVLLVACLLAEFNSFRTLLIILVTVPLAIFGTIPGLLLSGSPFGFMSLLGALSLVGIVVNNAIVLLDAVQRRRREGAPLEEALIAAIELRTRPIVLTMLTTAAGMLPLALSRSELWPPMAWAIISGLAVATALTLAVVPALYVLAFGSELRKGGARA